jgi:hypothetical protein
MTSLDVVNGTNIGEVYVLAPMASTEADRPLQPHLQMERRLRQVLTAALVQQAKAMGARGKRVTALSKLPASHTPYLTGHTFFPSLIAGPFAHGLDIAFDFGIAACLVAAVASLLRGRRYVHEEDGAAAAAADRPRELVSR